jgi:hypothetical protein
MLLKWQQRMLRTSQGPQEGQGRKNEDSEEAATNDTLMKL